MKFTETEGQTTLDLVREYFPGESEDFAWMILWNETGYPSFWHIGSDGDTPAECLRTQIAKAAWCFRTCAKPHGQFAMDNFVSLPDLEAAE